MNTPDRGSNNLFARRPLLMYFVLAYAFFWGFLILTLLILGLLGLTPTTLPGWLFSCFKIIGSWMPIIAAVTMIGLTMGTAGNRKLLEQYCNVHNPACSRAMVKVMIASVITGCSIADSVIIFCVSPILVPI